METTIDVSIVSGTYNRIESLKQLVNSIRQSIKYNLKYEIVLVDGGSTDGSIEWIKQQDDIRLIEHGELRGAIKAFNDGAYNAKGNYVILANDDIEFVNDSVWQAWLWMEKNPFCGIGCFYQNRNGKDWHVETMPCVLNDQQVFLYYLRKN